LDAAGPANFPAARERHALAYDAAHGQVVLFGGDSGNLIFTDTWVCGMKASISFSGLAPGFVGLYQINVEVPSGLKTGNQPVVVEVAGASSNSVLLPVQ
jgi:uncharacterized protein (TIGR03437 family)